MVAIIDYDAGNIKSVEKAMQLLGQEVKITRDRDEIMAADHVILPGVGALLALRRWLLCRGVGSAPPNGPVLLSPGRTRPLQAAPGKPPRPQKNVPPWGAFFSLKKPRRVCRPQAANQI